MIDIPLSTDDIALAVLFEYLIECGHDAKWTDSKQRFAFTVGGILVVANEGEWWLTALVGPQNVIIEYAYPDALERAERLMTDYPR